MWTRVCDCISFVKISYSVLIVTIVSCITPRFLDSSQFPRSWGLWQCWTTQILLLCSTLKLRRKCRLSYEDCAVSHNPNRERRLHCYHSLRLGSWSNVSLSKVRDRPCLKINKKSISRSGDFNDFKFFRTEVCNIKAPWFTSVRANWC